MDDDHPPTCPSCGSDDIAFRGAAPLDPFPSPPTLARVFACERKRCGLRFSRPPDRHA